MHKKKLIILKIFMISELKWVYIIEKIFIPKIQLAQFLMKDYEVEENIKL